MANELLLYYDTGQMVTAKVFRPDGTSSTVSMTEIPAASGRYVGSMPASAAGTYQVVYLDGTTQVGMEMLPWDGAAIQSPGKPSYHLGYTATYANNTMSISLWAERDGSVLGATAIKSASLLNGDGTPITDATWPDNTSSTNGVFVFSKAMTLNSGTRLIFTCTATVDGNDMPFRLGMARP